MAKKKRNKQYRGRDSSITPDVIRINAVPQSKLKEWWKDHKSDILFKLIPIAIVLVIAVLLWMIISAFS